MRRRARPRRGKASPWAVGNRTSLTDAENNTTGFGYDGVGRLTLIGYPNGDSEAYTYTSGRLASRNDGRGNVSYGYHPAGRLQTVTPYAGGSTTYVYDPNGNVTSASGGGVSVGYQYDSIDRLWRVDFSDPARYIEYAYDGSGLRTLMRNPEGAYVSYVYDTAGRLFKVALGQTPDVDPTAVYTYDDAGRRARLDLPNGCYTEYAYDGAGRLTGVTNRNSSGGVISSFSYNVDAVGNREDMTQTLGGVTHFVDYGYDDLYRLTSEIRKLGGTVVAQQAFTYDGVGNRMTHTAGNILGDSAAWCDQYSYNAANQLTQIVRAGGPTTAFGYDAAGNQVSKVVGTDTSVYAFDYRNRMVSFDGPGTENDTTYAFYPHHWARRSKTVDGTTTKFLYDGDDDVAEYDASGNALATYVTPFLDQNVAVTIPTGQPDAGTYCYLQDGLGSVRNLVDAAQAAQNTYDYEAFGQLFAAGTSEIVPNDYTFTARERDPESSLMYYRNRQYVPELGRFTAVDMEMPGVSWYERLAYVPATDVEVPVDELPAFDYRHLLTGYFAFDTAIQIPLDEPIAESNYLYVSGIPVSRGDSYGLHSQWRGGKRQRGIFRARGRWHCPNQNECEEYATKCFGCKKRYVHMIKMHGRPAKMAVDLVCDCLCAGCKCKCQPGESKRSDCRWAVVPGERPGGAWEPMPPEEYWTGLLAKQFLPAIVALSLGL